MKYALKMWLIAGVAVVIGTTCWYMIFKAVICDRSARDTVVKIIIIDTSKECFKKMPEKR